MPDESMENREKGIRGTKVTIYQENGDITNEIVLVPKGDPEKPLQKEDIIEKL